VIRQVDSWTIPQGQAPVRLPGPLNVLMRQTIEKERKFPIRTATALSSQFASAGLQFFKRDKVIVHVSVARPHYLDLETNPVREGIRKIVEFIEAHPKCTRKQLLAALAAPAPASTPAPAPAAAAEATPAAPGEAAAETAAAPAAPAPAAPQATPEQAAVLSDLHWLVHHVIEFANGALETAKRPMPRPEPQPKAEKPKGPRHSDRQGLLLLPAPNPALVGIDFPTSA
jgi:hypothetical protein